MKEEIKKELELLSVSFNSAIKSIYERLEQPKEVKKWVQPYQTTITVDPCRVGLCHTYALKLADFLQEQSTLHQLAQEINDGWEPDWNDSDQEKFTIYYHNVLNKYEWSKHYCHNNLAATFSRTARDKAIAMLNNGEVEGL
jgi:hypothetical protein